jgi:hypothetical protein
MTAQESTNANNNMDNQDTNELSSNVSSPSVLSTGGVDFTSLLTKFDVISDHLCFNE